MEDIGMTKKELLKEYHNLCSTKKVILDGIYDNSNKDTIQNAIDCLKCPDETLDEYMTVIKLKYPNTHRTIANNGDFKRHSYNRLHVYNTARLILS
jgi:hypothetical protein